MRFFTYNDIPEIAEILRLRFSSMSGGRCIAAIDGRAASGKTTLANKLSAELDNCTVFHTDDYFLPPEMRTEDRLNEPGGNFDRERFMREIIIPLKKNSENVRFRKFMCGSMTYSPYIDVSPTGIVIVEGAYCMHPDIRKSGIYSISIFSDTDRDIQINRIKERDGEDKLKVFKEKWIPLEEKYFHEFSIREKTDYIYKI